MMTSLASIVRLQSGIRGVTQSNLQHGLEWTSRHQTSLEDLFEQSPEQLQQILHISKETAQAILNQTSETVQPVVDQLVAKDWQVITSLDEAYPASLKRFSNMPSVLYVWGNVQLLTQSGLGFSGARDVSQDGLNITQTLVADAVFNGHQIISGHARGVDAIAHQTALETEGATLFVLPEGCLKFSLRNELRELVKQYRQHVVVVSEFPPLMPWATQNAMIRNKTIIGLSQGLCVIEAGNTGGTWAAANEALQMDIPLYVVDYENHPASAVGNAMLIQHGGIPIEFKGAQSRLPLSLKSNSKSKQLELF
jgi:DNA processing protein